MQTSTSAHRIARRVGPAGRRRRERRCRWSTPRWFARSASCTGEDGAPNASRASSRSRATPAATCQEPSVEVHAARAPDETVAVALQLPLRMLEDLRRDDRRYGNRDPLTLSAERSRPRPVTTRLATVVIRLAG